MFDLTLAYNAQNFHWWQFISAHFVHYDTKHLLLNAIALLILLFLFPAKIKELSQSMIFAIILISSYLLISPVQVYAGFSGLLYVIPGLTASRYLTTKQYLPFILIITALFVYILLLSTQIHNSNGIKWSALKQAHLLGFLSGFLVKAIKTRVLNRQLRRFNQLIRHN